MDIINDLEVEARIKMDLTDTARVIEYEFADSLITPPQGIYLNNHIEPVMRDGGYYYKLDIINAAIVRTPVTNITTLKQAIYTEGTDKEDKCIIPKVFMLNKSKYLSTTPVLPYYGIKILKKLIDNQINSSVHYRGSSYDMQHNLSAYFKPLPADKIIEIVTRYNELYEETHQLIKEFIGNHRWCLYFIKSKDCRITIEKSIDYRAYQWILHQQRLSENDEIDLQNKMNS